MIKRVKQLLKTLDPVQSGSGVFFYRDNNPPFPPFRDCVVMGTGDREPASGALELRLF